MAKHPKRGLGKGLGALLPIDAERLEEPIEEHAPRGSITYIPLDKIRPNPYQPREEFDRTALEDLKNSIREKGVIQPITVRKVADGFEIISGERRVRASIELGLKKIPAFILDVDSDLEMLELALIENIQRENLNPVEIALGYRYLVEERHLTQEEVAKKVGKDRATVSNFLRLLRLPAEILEALRKKKISMGHAKALLSLSDAQQQIALYRKIVNEKLSVRKVERLVRNLQKAAAEHPDAQNADDQRSSSHYQAIKNEIEDRLRQLLGTQVHVQFGPKVEKGKIEIKFYSVDELQRLLELFSLLERSGSQI